MRRILVPSIFLVSALSLWLNAHAQDAPKPQPEAVIPAPAPAVESAPSTPTIAPSPAAAEVPATPVVQAAPAASAAPAVRVIDLSGDWCGSWKSCVRGHYGPMRANFCRLTNGNYQVTFVGRFLKIVPFHYTTTLNVTGYGDGVVYLSGSQSLGPILGTFSYNAWANERQFVSGYSADKDQGQFVLSR